MASDGSPTGTAEIRARTQPTSTSGGMLLRTVAPTRAILAVPNIHSHRLEEADYVVDRCVLDRVDLMKSYDPE
jgi:hypothetical protein